MSAFFPVTRAAIGSKPGKMSGYAGVAILRPSAGTKTYGLFRADSLSAGLPVESKPRGRSNATQLHLLAPDSTGSTSVADQFPRRTPTDWSYRVYCIEHFFGTSIK